MMKGNFEAYFDVINRAKAKKVEKPPFSTAGPMLIKVFLVLSFRVPSSAVRKKWAIWAA